MKLLLLSAWCTLCFCLSAVGQQSAIDSILSILSSQKDSVRINSHCELTWLYRQVNQEKAIYHGNKAIELATKTNYSKGLAQAYNDLGIIYYDRESFDTAIDYYKKAIAIRKQLNDELGIAKLYNKIGIIYQEEAKFEQALEMDFKSLAIFEKFKLDKGISYAYGNIGVLQQNLGRLAEAIDYQTRSYNIKVRTGDEPGAVASLVNIGNIYVIKNNYEQAANYYSRAIVLCRRLKEPEYLGSTLNNLANMYRKLKKYNLAEANVTEALQNRTALQDHKGLVSSLDLLGSIYLETGRTAQADSVFHKALQISFATTNTITERSRLYQSLSQLYEKTGDLPKALAMHKLHTDTKDSLFSDNASKKYAELEVAYRTLGKEKTIEAQKYELNRRNTILGVTGIVMGLLLLLGLLLYRNSRIKARARLEAEVAHQQQIAAEAVLHAEEEERRSIASELHDGVGQLMSAAKMNLSSLEDSIGFQNERQRSVFKKAMDLVDMGCNEVRATSHLMMPGQLTNTTLDKAIEQFVEKMDNGKMKIQFHSEGFNEVYKGVQAKTDMFLYRIVQECINNVIRHSGASLLDLSLQRDAEGTHVLIQDDGQGFDASLAKTGKGLGLGNIQSRVAFLKGQVEWSSAASQGTSVSIFIPWA